MKGSISSVIFARFSVHWHSDLEIQCSSVTEGSCIYEKQML
jgi:hypothetical protein